MKNNFTKNQIAWASQHNWFISGNSETITVRNVFWDAGGKVQVSTGFFENFKSLRDWAGY